MTHLEELSVEDLQQALENVDDKKPAQRLLAAIAYKNGITQSELAEWYDVERRTIYSWLKRLDTDGSLEEAVSDAQRSGRPRKLSENEQDAFEQSLHQSPTEVGYDVQAWTPTLVQRHLEETYEVEYSIPSCRRLLKEAGLRYQKSLSGASKADTDDQGDTSSEVERDSGRWVPE
jgi:transposase